MATHVLSANPARSLRDRSLSPRLRIASRDPVHMERVDSSRGQAYRAMTLAKHLAMDRNRIHALAGPIFIEGAEPGDVLWVEVLAIAHKVWGWSSVGKGLGFPNERFREPYFFWQLDGAVCRSLSPAVVPLCPFCGVMGVARAEDGKFRARPPGLFGGKMDVRER